jgi:hypothetical protein
MSGSITKKYRTGGRRKALETKMYSTCPCPSEEAGLDVVGLFCRKEEGARYLLGERVRENDLLVIPRAYNSCIVPMNVGIWFSRLDFYVGQCSS